MENKTDLQANQNASENTVPQTSSIKMRLFNIACITLFAVGIVFFICFIDHADFNLSPVQYKELIIFSTVVVIVTIVILFLRTRAKIGVVKFAALLLAGIVLAANWYIYFRYVPKYGLADGCAIVNADPKYASATVEPQIYTKYNDNGELIIQTATHYLLENNPFFEWGYILNVVQDGKVTAWIAFDPATGKYEVFYEPKE